MPTYKVSMVLSNGRKVLTNFAGCQDEEDAKTKARSVYSVAKFIKIEQARELNKKEKK